MTMERKIGEIFEYEGEWYQCVEELQTESCDGCTLFKNDEPCQHKFGRCRRIERSDCKGTIFKKLETVSDPYPLYGHIVQRYAGIKSPFVLPREPYACFNLINSTIDIEVKQDKENTEDMETNEKTMPVPDGWEFDRIDDSGNIVLKEKKEELPKAWEDCLREIDKVEVLNCTADIMKIGINGCKEIDHHNRSMLPRGMGNPMLALCQLLICRNAWWKRLGWKPDWNDCKSMKHCIHGVGFSITNITRHSTFPRLLAFPTEDTAMEFCNTFKDLIEEAKELL